MHPTLINECSYWSQWTVAMAKTESVTKDNYWLHKLTAFGWKSMVAIDMHICAILFEIVIHPPQHKLKYKPLQNHSRRGSYQKLQWYGTCQFSWKRKNSTSKSKYYINTVDSTVELKENQSAKDSKIYTLEKW